MNNTKTHPIISVVFLTLAMSQFNFSFAQIPVNCPPVGSNIIVQDYKDPTTAFGQVYGPNQQLYPDLIAATNLAATQPNTYLVAPSDDVAVLLESICPARTCTAATTIFFRPGIYNVDGLKIPSNITLTGIKNDSGEVVFSGAVRLTNWTPIQGKENLWEHSVKVNYEKNFDNTQDPGCNCTDPVAKNNCPCDCQYENSTRCQFSNDLFINGIWAKERKMDTQPETEGNWCFQNMTALDESLYAGSIFMYSASNPNNQFVTFSKKEIAFRDEPSDFRVNNIVFSGYRDVAIRIGSNVLIKNCTFQNMHKDGLVIRSDNVTVKWSRLVDNGRSGISIVGAVNTIVQHCEIANNNRKLFTKGNHAGGLKATRSINVLLKENYVHGNEGVGLWFDSFCKKAYTQSNLIENNWRGVFYEICLGDDMLDDSTNKINNETNRSNWEIANNYIVGGERGIMLTSSSNVEIRYNTVVNSLNGIEIIQDTRDYINDVLQLPGEWVQMKNVIVKNNEVHQYVDKYKYVPAGFRVSKSILTETNNECNTSCYYTTNNIVFNDNKYLHAKSDPYFFWGADLPDDPNLDGLRQWGDSLPQHKKWVDATHARDDRSCLVIFNPSGESLAAFNELQSMTTKSESDSTVVYPNPFTNRIVIRLPNVVDLRKPLTITLSDLNGEGLDYSILQFDSEKREVLLSLGGTSQAIYNLRISQGKFYYTTRLLKQ